MNVFLVRYGGVLRMRRSGVLVRESDVLRMRRSGVLVRESDVLRMGRNGVLLLREGEGLWVRSSHEKRGARKVRCVRLRAGVGCKSALDSLVELHCKRGVGRVFSHRWLAFFGFGRGAQRGRLHRGRPLVGL